MKKLLISILLLSSCSVFTPNSKIYNHPNFSNLDFRDKVLVAYIIPKINYVPKKDYYFSKLELLLNTKTEELSNIKYYNEKVIYYSYYEMTSIYASLANSIDINKYMNIEENYEKINYEKQWKILKFANSNKYYYVQNNNPNDLLLHVRICLIGKDSEVNLIKTFEDATEKHLSLSGYSVNIEFTNECKNEDVLDINVNFSEWPNSENFIGGYTVLAHELMHKLSSNNYDTYDRIEAHAGNKYLSVHNRLLLFLMGINDKSSKTGELGIMNQSKYKPLNYNICNSVGLEEDCRE